MHGNVLEFCQDWYGKYDRAIVAPLHGENRVLRGGSFYAVPNYCRSASRYHRLPENRYASSGFRVLRSYP